MHEAINEPVDVTVEFAGPRVRPLSMRWNKREYELGKPHLVHAAHEGRKRVFYFSVSDASNYFKLRLDPELLRWTLMELYAEG